MSGGFSSVFAVSDAMEVASRLQSSAAEVMTRILMAMTKT